MLWSGSILYHEKKVLKYNSIKGKEAHVSHMYSLVTYFVDISYIMKFVTTILACNLAILIGR